MEKNLYIDASHPNETRVVLKSDDNIEDYEYEGLKNNLIKNNIYLGKVSRIEPSLQAAFIDFGRERHGFLSFNDIQSDYYQIPKADLDKIKEEEEKAREELSKEVEAKEEENIAEGKLEIDDPINIEKEPIEESENDSEDKENLTEEKDKKKETKFKFKRYKIQEVIKPNQVILVQVIKDERGQKGAALSTFISIAGKYIVLMPNTPIAPSLIHQESEIIKRTLRDMYDDNTQNIIVEGNEGYKKAQTFMKMIMPSNVKKVKKYRGKVPLVYRRKYRTKIKSNI
jgi:ribonuclease E